MQGYPTADTFHVESRFVIAPASFRAGILTNRFEDRDYANPLEGNERTGSNYVLPRGALGKLLLAQGWSGSHSSRGNAMLISQRIPASGRLGLAGFFSGKCLANTGTDANTSRANNIALQSKTEKPTIFTIYFTRLNGRCC